MVTPSRQLPRSFAPVCRLLVALLRADRRRLEQAPPPSAPAGKAVDPATAGIDHRARHLHRQGAGARRSSGCRAIPSCADGRRPEAAERRGARRGRRRAAERVRATSRTASIRPTRSTTPVDAGRARPEGLLLHAARDRPARRPAARDGEHRSHVPQRARAAEGEPGVQPRPCDQASRPMRHTFTAPEVMVRFKCDVHGWMAAYVGVMAASVLRGDRR